MNIPFVKYHGTGNDFVLIDNRTGFFPTDNLDLVRDMCDRHFGVGSDGLMLIQNHGEANFEMVFFNPDGSKSLCGNGSRCAVHFAFGLEMIPAKGTMLSTDGIHAYRIDEQKVGIELHPVQNVEAIGDDFFVNTGSPHLIVPRDELDQFPVVEAGRKRRYEEQFESIGGTNVNFVSKLNGENNFRVRTYERGVEDETLSCGTGVTAVALAMAKAHNIDDHVMIQVEGGSLEVTFRKKGDGFDNIWLWGPAQMIFKGEYHVGE